jgi:hypothetical protein
MDKHGYPVFEENDVWASWQVVNVQAESESLPKQRGPNSHLRLGIPALNSGHQAATALGGKPISHEALSTA